MRVAKLFLVTLVALIALGDISYAFSWTYLFQRINQWWMTTYGGRATQSQTTQQSTSSSQICTCEVCYSDNDCKKLQAKVEGDCCYYDAYCTYGGCCDNCFSSSREVVRKCCEFHKDCNPSCNNRCETKDGVLRWVHNGVAKCTDNGWECHYEYEECKDKGECCVATCDADSGCNVKPADYKCGDGEYCGQDCKCHKKCPESICLSEVRFYTPIEYGEKGYWFHYQGEMCGYKYRENCDDKDCTTGLTCSGVGTDTLIEMGDDYSCSKGECSKVRTKVCGTWTCDASNAFKSSQKCGETTYYCCYANGKYQWQTSPCKSEEGGKKSKPEEREQPQGKPDLVITKVWINNVWTDPYRYHHVSFTVKNQGDVDVGYFSVGLYVNGAWKTSKGISSLKSGSSVSKYFRFWSCTPGKIYTIKVCADWDKRITESNENNNCLQKDFLRCPSKTEKEECKSEKDCKHIRCPAVLGLKPMCKNGRCVCGSGGKSGSEGRSSTPQLPNLPHGVIIQSFLQRIGELFSSIFSRIRG